MLAGEYAVLAGGRCLAVTIDRWLAVGVSARREPGVRVSSDLWPAAYELSQLTADACAREPLLQTLFAYGDEHPLSELAVEVRSNLDVKSGFGSSSAVRLATLLALDAYFKGSHPAAVMPRAHQVWQLQKAQQGFASGYDVLTQASGGLILWRPDYASWPGKVERLPLAPLDAWVQVWVGGAGAPTTAVGGSVRQHLAQDGRAAALRSCSEQLVDGLLALLQEGQPRALHTVLDANKKHREILAAAPHYPRSLLAVLSALPGCDAEWTFKTSGAGGEDALLLIGPAAQLGAPAQRLEALGWRRLEGAFTEKRAYSEIKGQSL